MFPQQYVAVPEGKTMLDIKVDPSIAYQYSDVDTLPLPEGYEWIVNDVSLLAEGVEE